MIIQMFNFWYFFWLLLMAGAFIGLYFLLRNKSERTKNIVLFSILAFALLLHFLKAFFPPYSTDEARFFRDIWFINICAVNILFFPFIFLSRSKVLRDYMFYIGVLSGAVAILYPMEPLLKVDQTGELLDIVRYYIHHGILFIVPLLMVVFGLHKLSYRRVIKMAPVLLGVFLFIMMNQLLQQELGFTPVRGSGSTDITEIGYKNSSYIWGADDGDFIGTVLRYLTPNVFKTIPVGEYAGQAKEWPFFWLIVPVYVLFTPLCFGLSMIFDRQNFLNDWGRVKLLVKTRLDNWRARRK